MSVALPRLVVPPDQFPTDTLRGSHNIAGRADVYVSGVKVAEMGIVDGEVVLDRTRFVRGTVAVELLADWPGADNTAPLNPYTSEVQLYRGAASIGATPVLVPVGRYRVDDVRGDPNRRTTLTATGTSREVYLFDDRFERPVTFSSEPVADRLVRLVGETLPGAPVTVTTTNPGSASGTWDEDRSAAVVACAQACGGEFYADDEGPGFQLAPVPALSDPVVWMVDAGQNGVMVSAAESLSRDGVYNAVTVRAQNTTEDIPPVQATAYDDNPSSPTRWGGPFGRKRRFYSSPVVTTEAQCQSAAQALLDDALGLHHTLALTSVANPALRPGDVVQVIFADGSTQVHLVDTMTIPLGLRGTQRLSTRAGEVVSP